MTIVDEKTDLDTVLAETGNQVYAKSYIEGATYVNDLIIIPF